MRIFYILLALFSVLAVWQITRIVLTQKQMTAVPSGHAVEAAAEADLEVVEFIDYSCPFCQMIHPTITEAVMLDGKVRYIPKPLPTTNKRSTNAAIHAYAAGRQGKFIEMHNALIADFPNLTDEKLARLVLQLGLDQAQFAQDMRNPEIEKTLQDNATQFERFGTKATPTFVIGKKMLYVPSGAMPTADDFLRMFNEAREQDK
jgi:protein-disulfide isomerase